ncbi:hypothetical protein C8R45DRAFT_1208991, partial [Mycena sanguinolenta]
MSILVSGAYTSLVDLSGSPVTAVAAAFLQRIAPHRRNNQLALTINGGPNGSFTTVLECSVQRDLAVDVSLGLDWTSSAREWLISLNLPCSPDIVRSLLYAVKPADSSSTGIGQNTLELPAASQPASMQMPAHAGWMPDHTWRLPIHTGWMPARAGQMTFSTERDKNSNSNVASSSCYISSVVQGPSHCTSGLDGVFTSVDRLVNLLDCDVYTVYNYMDFHG